MSNGGWVNGQIEPCASMWAEQTDPSTPPPSLHSSFESWPSQNPFHHWCIPFIKKHQWLSAGQTGTLRHSQVPYYAPNPTCPLLHFPSYTPVYRSVFVFFPGNTFVVMDERWASFWQACSWCHIITVSPFRQNYQIIPTPRRHWCDWQVQPTKETQIFRSGSGRRGGGKREV